MRTRAEGRWAVPLLLAAAAGCAQLEPELRIEVEPRAQGAAIWLEGEMAADGEAQIALWAADLGSVFGLALHLRFDPELVEVQEPRLVEVLGAAADGDALYLSTVTPGDVGMGATRAAPERGEVELGAPVLLGELSLRYSGGADAALRLERAQVRRADASFTPVAATGASLVVEGGAL